MTDPIARLEELMRKATENKDWPWHFGLSSGELAHLRMEFVALAPDLLAELKRMREALRIARGWIGDGEQRGASRAGAIAQINAALAPLKRTEGEG